MAKTQRGRSLTAAFQRNSRVAGDRAGKRLRETWSLLDPNNIWGSTDEWLYQITPPVQAAFAENQRLAQKHLRDYSRAEGITVDDAPTPGLDVAAFHEDMRYRGPLVIVDKIREGTLPVVAKNTTLERLRDTVSMWVQDGGRGVIIGASKYSGKKGRWRRVASGVEPCAFCGMLAGRGPVYTSETVRFRAHPGCNCTAEIVDSEWEPTEKEHLWRLSYDLAAEQASAAGQARVAPSVAKKNQHEDNILWRMRRNTPELFSDGVYPKI